MAQRNAQRTFVVQELGPTGGQRTGELLEAYEDTPVRFEWDARRQSSPRSGWEYAVRQRTVREDYPGTDEPVEQVLGPNYEPFSLRGVWDDRYNQEGFAENQRVEFEKLVQRGNLVRLSFEKISITGLVTNFKANYLREYQVSYEFTFSPHFRKQGGDARRGRVLNPRVRNPTESVQTVSVWVDNARVLTQNMPSPLVTGDLYTQVSGVVTSWQAQIDTINNVISGRVLVAATSEINSISKVVQGFSSLKILAASSLPLVATQSTVTGLSFEAANLNLQFEEWIRGFSNSARRIMVDSSKAAKDLSKLVTSQNLAIYHPRKGETLYGISNRFFGTPHKWRDIADRNNLHDFTLNGTEFLIIPARRS